MNEEPPDFTGPWRLECPHNFKLVEVHARHASFESPLKRSGPRLGELSYSTRPDSMFCVSGPAGMHRLVMSPPPGSFSQSGKLNRDYADMYGSENLSNRGFTGPCPHNRNVRITRVVTASRPRRDDLAVTNFDAASGGSVGVVEW